MQRKLKTLARYQEEPRAAHLWVDGFELEYTHGVSVWPQPLLA